MWWLIALWVVACAADEWTSWYSRRFLDLREVNPLARDSHGRFDLKKGLIDKAIVTAALGGITYLDRIAGLLLFGVLDAVTFFFAGWNLWLELHDKSARS